ncbi:16S rRNA (guanine(966)-N(2))-methyltransferase RsmD [Tepidibacter formicigenes]|jgi:16S rRNA (guanine(966)-N(2))-methyltransferase RsmD|uniref:16S rRNA (Guanine(966)-N(2))-methyltransferase RsmD n=1 Tax=Tepidibacter formicigenes DSM 15518 TaxID=1123349 RepID=A0A1M6KI84_9FIRM|nr:16S rRNA (guanine(966)-N(2))-methyltransferase RsmD [Tepidibacter formicigenes]SHJ58635.1 16S rRNA (guanine(966)-N(2))-methyltransferase RsmD [Tepidibacter formicigenes DSM 15518]
MRVISGSARGLKLKSPKGMDVRPTTDRVKESVFNIINNRLIDSFVLDIFSGTGSLGIEALSRGAQKCTFIDSSKESIKVIKENIEKARVNDKSEVILSDAISAINKLGVRRDKFDIIFMDPPYLKNLIEPVLEEISKKNILEEDGIIIVEHDTKDELLEEINNLYKYREKKYGNTTISFFALEE